tara:strand:- start:3190 stop:3963 length:774 start_codon:yes stop_codon:yes gene_type:complete
MIRILLLTLLVLATFISKGQSIINITSNTTIPTLSNNTDEYNISDNVELTINGDLTNYGGKFILLGCNSKLKVIANFTGDYNAVDIERYCDDCNDLNNFTYNTGVYSNDYLTVNGGVVNWVGVDCQVPLPVELISYTCNKKEILWSTGSEINSDYFTVLYSDNGMDFTPLTNINAQGNSFEVVNYSYPITNKGYYKLTQTDYDGTTEKFDIKFCGPDNDKVKLVARYDLLGQTIQDSYRGIVIEVYSDGSTKRIYKN